MQLCGSLSIPWHCLSLGLEWELTFSSPVATAEFSKFAGILSAALSQHHLPRFEIAQLDNYSSNKRIFSWHILNWMDWLAWCLSLHSHCCAWAHLVSQDWMLLTFFFTCSSHCIQLSFCSKKKKKKSLLLWLPRIFFKWFCANFNLKEMNFTSDYALFCIIISCLIELFCL